MDLEPVNSTKVAGALEELRQELLRLGERVAALEAGGGKPERPGAQPPSSAPRTEQAAVPAGLDEELIVIISSAIAAFLGKKPHIRQIRLIGSTAWAQQGRVTIQASHALSAYSARSYS
jgi:methylmalonyl-CoA carboxyltransferase large subunit